MKSVESHARMPTWQRPTRRCRRSLPPWLPRAGVGDRTIDEDHDSWWVSAQDVKCAYRLAWEAWQHRCWQKWQGGCHPAVPGGCLLPSGGGVIYRHPSTGASVFHGVDFSHKDQRCTTGAPEATRPPVYQSCSPAIPQLGRRCKSWTTLAICNSQGRLPHRCVASWAGLFPAPIP